MEDINFRYNLKNNPFFVGGWFSQSKWGNLQLPRRKEGGMNVKEGKSRLFEPPTFKTVVWAGQ